MGQNAQGDYFSSLVYDAEHPVPGSRAEGPASRYQRTELGQSGGISSQAISPVTSAPTRAASSTGCRGGSGMVGWSRRAAAGIGPRSPEHLPRDRARQRDGRSQGGLFTFRNNQDLFVPAGHQPSASLISRKMETENVTTVSVPVVALDDYFDENDKVALFKIDVEGAELALLRGAERILRRQAPLLVFECENRHCTPRQRRGCVFLSHRPRLRGKFRVS